MTRKRILITISSLKIGGGAERIASILGTELYERECDVHFLTFYDRKQKYDFEGKYSSLYEKDSKNIIMKMWKLVHRAYKIAQYCKKHEIDTTIGFMEEANFPLALSKYFGNKSKIIISQRNNPNNKIKLEKKLIKITYPKADLVVALSKGVEEKLQKRYNLKKTTTIYNTLKNKKQNNRKKRTSKDIFRFITLGRLAEQKGQWHLLRAFKKVLGEQEAELIILGKGPLEKNLKTLSKKLGIQKKVKFLGVKKNIYKYLNESDCFIFTSLWEGFGNVLVEALQTNIPIISTDCHSGPREILAPELNITEKIIYPYYGTYGILIESFKREQYTTKRFEATKLNKQEEQLAEMMKEMMIKETLRKRYNKGAKRADDFTPENIIKQWEEII